MIKVVLTFFILLFLFSCKTSKSSCDAYGSNNDHKRIYKYENSSKIIQNSK